MSLELIFEQLVAEHRARHALDNEPDTGPIPAAEDDDPPTGPIPISEGGEPWP